MVTPASLAGKGWAEAVPVITLSISDKAANHVVMATLHEMTAFANERQSEEPTIAAKQAEADQYAARQRPR